MVVAGDWSGAFVSPLCLHLQILGVFFPSKFHGYFNPSKDQVIPWLDFWGTGDDDNNVIFVFSGLIEFLRGTLPLLNVFKGVIITVDVKHQGQVSSWSVLQRCVKQGCKLCADYDLRPLVVGIAAAGRASDVQHFFDFGNNLLSAVAPVVEPGLWWTVQNILDGGVGGRFPSVLQETVPPLANPARAVLWHDGIVQQEGLFPCRSPDSKVYCPSYKQGTLADLYTHHPQDIATVPDATFNGHGTGWSQPNTTASLFGCTVAGHIYFSLPAASMGDTWGGGLDLDISTEIHNTTDEVEEQDGLIGHYEAIGDHQGSTDEVEEQDGLIGQDKAIGAHQGLMDKVEEWDGPIRQDEAIKIHWVDDSAEGEDDEANPNAINDQESEVMAHLPDKVSWHFNFNWDLLRTFWKTGIRYNEKSFFETTLTGVIYVGTQTSNFPVPVRDRPLPVRGPKQERTSVHFLIAFF